MSARHRRHVAGLRCLELLVEQQLEEPDDDRQYLAPAVRDPVERLSDERNAVRQAESLGAAVAQQGGEDGQVQAFASAHLVPAPVVLRQAVDASL